MAMHSFFGFGAYCSIVALVVGGTAAAFASPLLFLPWTMAFPLFLLLHQIVVFLLQRHLTQKRALMDHATEVASHEGPAFSDHEMSQREDFSAHHVFPTVFSLYAESRSHRPYHLL